MAAKLAADVADPVLAAASLEAPPPLFEQTNVRKPEYWQFARLIAPATTLPPGKKQWTADDAAGIWCLKCEKALVFQKGSSQSIRYHMETKHRVELEAFREHGRPVAVVVPVALALAPTAPVVPAAVASPVATGSARIAKKRRTSGGGTSELLDDNDSSGSGGAGAVAATAAATPVPTAAWTWARNLERRGGFWGDAAWYDVHLERRLPLVRPMLEELVAALPPCDGKHVLDLLAGSGRATEALVAAYPGAFVTLVDASAERLALAQRRLRARGVALADEQFLAATLAPATLATASPVPVDVVVGCLALHVLAERPAHYVGSGDAAAVPSAVPAPVDPVAAKEALYEQLFRGVFELLKPGGHFLMGDHVGQLPLFAQLRLLARAGFVDVDCAWRQTDFFVAGARRPRADERPNGAPDA